MATTITITEALAEIKTIDKKLAKKREFINSYLHRQERFKDPLEKEGGSVSVLKREMQAIDDLEERKIAIRRAISKANDTTVITLAGKTRTIAEWLSWRRDVAPARLQFLNGLKASLDKMRRESMARGLSVAGNVSEARPDDVVVNIREADLNSQLEKHDEIVSALDGQLSLKNATVLVEF